MELVLGNRFVAKQFLLNVRNSVEVVVVLLEVTELFKCFVNLVCDAGVCVWVCVCACVCVCVWVCRGVWACVSCEAIYIIVSFPSYSHWR